MLRTTHGVLVLHLCMRSLQHIKLTSCCVGSQRIDWHEPPVFAHLVAGTACPAKEAQRDIGRRCRPAHSDRNMLCTSNIGGSGPVWKSNGVAGMQPQEQQRRAAAELQALQARCHAAETEAAALRRAPR